MAGLRTLLDFPTESAGGSVTYSTLTVYNTSITSQENGGRCCQWTVPAGVTWFAVEMWGGGGGGAGACCCRAGWPGGSGSYARRIVTGVAEGQTYRICAAGSTYCAQSYCKGCIGYPSYVYDEQQGINIACASGGAQGCSRCFFFACNCQGCEMQQCGSWCGGFGICGVTGQALGSPMCAGDVVQFMPSAPFTMGNMRATKDACSGYCGGCCVGGYAMFPGGGGATSNQHNGNFYCGAAGAGGLVNIFYGAAG